MLSVCWRQQTRKIEGCVGIIALHVHLCGGMQAPEWFPLGLGLDFHVVRDHIFVYSLTAR